MEFNRGDSGSNLQSEINITPLVDVVLVLLIIFMVVVPLLMQGYDVDIPKTSNNAKPAQSQESRLILIISATTCGILKPSAAEGLPTDCRVILGDQKIAQYHATIGRKPLRCRGLEDAAGRGGDDQDQPRFLGLRGLGIGRGLRNVDVITLHQERNDDHEDDQQHEHYVDERRDVNLRLQIGSGIASVELHSSFSSPSAGALGDQPHPPETGLLDRLHGLSDLTEVEL